MSATVYDLLAKISWDTNEAELNKVVNLSKEQDKLLEELRKKGRRLEEQMMKTNDPVKLKKYNDELQKIAATALSITAAQKKQADSLDGLKKKQQDFIEQLKKTNDPKTVQGLLRGLYQVENQLELINRQAETIPQKFGGLGSSLMQGLGIGAGIMSIESIMGGVKEFIGSSIAEFEDAEETALNLGRSLKVIGKEKYFDGLIEEASDLAVQFHNLFDNDDIIKAQTKLVNYGKLSRNEISKLTPVILELATAEKIDLVQATEKVIGIMEGRGGETLRQYGISVKGVKSEHDRLNIVLGDFRTKLKGSADVYAETAEGIAQTNKVLIANIEENFGASFARLRTKILPIITEIITAINYGLESVDETNKREYDVVKNAYLKKYEGLSKERLKIEAENNKEAAKELMEYQNLLSKNEAINQDNLGYIEKKKINDRIKSYKDYINQKSTFITGNQLALNKLLAQEDKDADKTLNKNATMYEETEKKAKVAKDKKVKIAKEEKIDLAKIKEDEFKQTLQYLDEYNEAEINKIQIQLSDKKITEDEYQDKMLSLDAEYYVNKIIAYEDYGKSALKLQTDLLKKFEAINKRQKPKVAGVTGEFVPGTGGNSIELPEDFTSALANDAEVTAAKKKEAEITAAKKAAARERNNIAAEELYYNSQQLASAVSDAIAQESNRTSNAISLQEKRVEEAKKSSDASVKIEEDRLNALIEKRTKFERAQRIIDAAVIVANQAVAISGAIKQIATSENFVETAANVAAIVAGIVVATTAVRSAFSDPGYYEGGYTGEGNPHDVSTAQGKRGYKYHKKEFVMNEKLTSKHRDMFEGIHKGNLMVQQIGSGYYLAPTIDVDKAVSDYSIGKDGSNYELMLLANKLGSIESILQQRELTVNNNFDADGFGQAVAGQMKDAQIKNLMR